MVYNRKNHCTVWFITEKSLCCRVYNRKVIVLYNIKQKSHWDVWFITEKATVLYNIKQKSHWAVWFITEKLLYCII